MFTNVDSYSKWKDIYLRFKMRNFIEIRCVLFYAQLDRIHSLFILYTQKKFWVNKNDHSKWPRNDVYIYFFLNGLKSYA